MGVHAAAGTTEDCRIGRYYVKSWTTLYVVQVSFPNSLPDAPTVGHTRFVICKPLAPGHIVPACDERRRHNSSFVLTFLDLL